MTETNKPSTRFSWRTLILFLVPIILLAGVIALFLTTGGGLSFEPAAPVEDLTVERYVLNRGSIELHVRNTGPQELTIAQIVINSAVVRYTIEPSTTIPRLGHAEIHLNYPWTYAEAYSITIFTSNWGFTLIGLFVGVIPVFLGIFWFPALRQLGRQAMTFLMAATAGLLVFLGLDTVAEALEVAGKLPSVFQGIGMIGIGAVATFLLLDAISRQQTHVSGDEATRRLSIAMMISIGIGLHNLGEGLAIGAAYNIGEIALGSFLVVGFIIQNITEGLGIIAPVLRDRPGIGKLALMGIVGGGPAIIGAWIGGFSPSPFLAVLFLAIGTGAIAEVVYEIAKLIKKDIEKQSMPYAVFSGVLTGMLLLWVTGLMIK